MTRVTGLFCSDTLAFGALLGSGGSPPSAQPLLATYCVQLAPGAQISMRNDSFHSSHPRHLTWLT